MFWKNKAIRQSDLYRNTLSKKAQPEGGAADDPSFRAPATTLVIHLQQAVSRHGTRTVSLAGIPTFQEREEAAVLHQQALSLLQSEKLRAACRQILLADRKNPHCSQIEAARHRIAQRYRERLEALGQHLLVPCLPLLVGARFVYEAQKLYMLPWLPSGVLLIAVVLCCLATVAATVGLHYKKELVH